MLFTYLYVMLSYTEENYLKALFHLTAQKNEREEAGTNELAAHLCVKPATANDMLKKLKEKKTGKLCEVQQIFAYQTGNEAGSRNCAQA